ncbi:uncharacterized protein V6R79_008534 [Siganus canaliculatus]
MEQLLGVFINYVQGHYSTVVQFIDSQVTLMYRDFIIRQDIRHKCHGTNMKLKWNPDPFGYRDRGLRSVARGSVKPTEVMLVLLRDLAVKSSSCGSRPSQEQKALSSHIGYDVWLLSSRCLVPPRSGSRDRGSTLGFFFAAIAVVPPKHLRVLLKYSETSL